MDFTKCTNKTCSRRNECYRYRLIPNKNCQSYANFDGNKCFLSILPGDKLCDEDAKPAARG